MCLFLCHITVLLHPIRIHSIKTDEVDARNGRVRVRALGRVVMYVRTRCTETVPFTEFVAGVVLLVTGGCDTRVNISRPDRRERARPCFRGSIVFSSEGVRRKTYVREANCYASLSSRMKAGRLRVGRRRKGRRRRPGPRLVGLPSWSRPKAQRCRAPPARSRRPAGFRLTRYSSLCCAPVLVATREGSTRAHASPRSKLPTS